MEKDTTEPQSRAREYSPNLRPWQPGQSGNPSGKRSVGKTILEWMNEMAEWPIEKVQTVAENPKESAARRAAAARFLGADKTNRDGTANFDCIMDRSLGKPTQSIEVNGQVQHVCQLPDDALERIALAAMDRLAALGQPDAPAALPVIDAPAEPAE